MSWPVPGAADTAAGSADGAAEDVAAGVSGAALDAEVVCPCATGAFAAPAAAHPQMPRTAARPATPARTRNPSLLRPAMPARAPPRVTTDHGTARTPPSGARLAPVTTSRTRCPAARTATRPSVSQHASQVRRFGREQVILIGADDASQGQRHPPAVQETAVPELLDTRLL